MMRGKTSTCRRALQTSLVYDLGKLVGDQKKLVSCPASQRLAAHRRGRARARDAGTLHFQRRLVVTGPPGLNSLFPSRSLLAQKRMQMIKRFLAQFSVFTFLLAVSAVAVSAQT